MEQEESLQVAVNKLKLDLELQRITAESRKDILEEVKGLAEETSEIVAESLTEFRSIVGHHDKDIVRLDQIVRSGNGNKPLIVRIALIEQELPNVKNEMITIRDSIHKDHLKILAGMSKSLESREAKEIEDKKDRRDARVAIIVAIVSLIGTVVTAALAYFKP